LCGSFYDRGLTLQRSWVCFQFFGEFGLKICNFTVSCMISMSHSSILSRHMLSIQFV